MLARTGSASGAAPASLKPRGALEVDVSWFVASAFVVGRDCRNDSESRKTKERTTKVLRKRFDNVAGVNPRLLSESVGFWVGRFRGRETGHSLAQFPKSLRKRFVIGSGRRVSRLPVLEVLS